MVVRRTTLYGESRFSEKEPLEKGGSGPWVTDPEVAHGSAKLRGGDHTRRRVLLSLPYGQSNTGGFHFVFRVY